MSQTNKDKPENTHACGRGSTCGAEPIVLTEPRPEPAGIPVFHIPTMDCAAEEGEIRHTLENIPGLRSLSFQLGARTLAIDAPTDSIPHALEAIRKAGFKPVPVAESSGHDEHDEHGHDHKHGGFTLPEGLPRYGLALLLAFGAESVAFFAPNTLAFTGLGMALAAVAIGLAKSATSGLRIEVSAESCHSGSSSVT